MRAPRSSNSGTNCICPRRSGAYFAQHTAVRLVNFHVPVYVHSLDALADYNDDTLRAHQDEINKLQLKLKEYKPIIVLIERREMIKREREELDASAQDKSRLLSKNSSVNLLREEKVRRMVSKEMPKIDEKLKSTLKAWESMYGQPFLYHGEHYLHVIEDDAQAEQAKKDKAREMKVRVFGYYFPDRETNNLRRISPVTGEWATLVSTGSHRRRVPYRQRRVCPSGRRPPLLMFDGCRLRHCHRVSIPLTCIACTTKIGNWQRF